MRRGVCGEHYELSLTFTRKREREKDVKRRGIL